MLTDEDIKELEIRLARRGLILDYCVALLERYYTSDDLCFDLSGVPLAMRCEAAQEMLALTDRELDALVEQHIFKRLVHWRAEKPWIALDHYILGEVPHYCTDKEAHGLLWRVLLAQKVAVVETHTDRDFVIAALEAYGVEL